jgi:ethanolaminephosphotransferase
MAAAGGYGSSPLGLFTVLIPCAPMFLSSWEQYHTGTLYLGFFNGPCEGIIIACTLMSLSAIYGPQFYHQRAIDVIGWPITNRSMVMYDLFVALCLAGLFLAHIPSWYDLLHVFLIEASTMFTSHAKRETNPSYQPSHS